MTRKRIVKLSVLPGQPLDGSGKICIHLFVQDEHGPFTEHCVMHMEEVQRDGHTVKQAVNRPTRGRLACDSKKTRKVAPVDSKGVTSITMRTDDPRAVTCDKCKASQAYLDMMEVLAKT